MKKLYSVLIALGVLALVASVAGAAEAKPAYPSWSKQINTTNRLTVLNAFGGAAVLDNETGLVWEQSPSTNTFTWLTAPYHCNNLTVGNRKGWRLPTIQELASLVDPSVPFLTLPTGHPFSNVQASYYWSATADTNVSSFAWVMFFSLGDVGFEFKDVASFVWCVRGGQGVDSQ